MDSSNKYGTFGAKDMSDDEEAVPSRSNRQGGKRSSGKKSDINPDLATDIYHGRKSGGKAAGSLKEKLIGWEEDNISEDIEGSGSSETDSVDDIESHGVRKSTIHDLTKREFYKQENWFEEMCEILFKISERGTTVKAELYFGIIHFISCFYCIAVVPQQLNDSGYDTKTTSVAVALCSGVGSIFCGLFANLPFVLAPPTVVSIFLAGFNRQNNLSPEVGNFGVIFSGALLTLFYYRPLGEFVGRLIPLPIQVGTAVGIGLLTCLAGSTEIDLVETGSYKILRMGELSMKIVIAFVGFFLICVAMRYHIKGSFCLAVVFCTIFYWAYNSDFPTEVASWPLLTLARFREDLVDSPHIPLLTGDLLFLYVLYLNGLVSSLSSLAVLTRDDGAIPRGRWIFVMSGFFTICGGLLTSAPILVSPESSAAIKDGAKTGLSTVVAGILFILAVFFSPLFDSIPASGTSPVLLMIGLILFQNVNRIDWRKVADAAPAFVVLFYIPFTYSIIQGVLFGYVLYIAITLCTGELLENFLILLLIYFPWLEPHLMEFSFLEPYLLRVPSRQSDAAKVAIAKAHANPAVKPLRQTDLDAAAAADGEEDEEDTSDSKAYYDDDDDVDGASGAASGVTGGLAGRIVRNRRTGSSSSSSSASSSGGGGGAVVYSNPDDTSGSMETTDSSAGGRLSLQHTRRRRASLTPAGMAAEIAADSTKSTGSGVTNQLSSRSNGTGTGGAGLTVHFANTPMGMDMAGASIDMDYSSMADYVSVAPRTRKQRAQSLNLKQQSGSAPFARDGPNFSTSFQRDLPAAVMERTHSLPAAATTAASAAMGAPDAEEGAVPSVSTAEQPARMPSDEQLQHHAKVSSGPNSPTLGEKGSSGKRSDDNKPDPL